MESDADSIATLSRSSNTSDNDDEYKICAVCGDKATGYHFRAMTCEGCKGFFRRTVKKGHQFSCPFTRTCTITKKNRKQCPACRFQKCLESGMQSDLVMSDEVVAMRRALIKGRKENQVQQALEIEKESLTPQQNVLIDILVNAHQRCFISNLSQISILRDMTQDTEASCSPNDQSNLSSISSESLRELRYVPDKSGHQFSTLSVMAQIVEIITFITRQVINFAKEIPAFRSLPIEDQITLLKGSTFEVGQIISNTAFNLHTCMWDYGSDQVSIKDATDAGLQQWFIEPIFKFHKNLRSLELHAAEYALMATLSIFAPDRPGLMQQDTIERIQEEFAGILKAYINQNRPVTEKRMLFPRLLSFLTELRSLSEIRSKQILLIQEGLWPPLMKEIFS